MYCNDDCGRRWNEDSYQSDDSYIKTVIVDCHQPSFINNNNYYCRCSARSWFIIVTGLPDALAGPVRRIHTNNNNISSDAVPPTSLCMTQNLIWNRMRRVRRNKSSEQQPIINLWPFPLETSGKTTNWPYLFNHTSTPNPTEK